jgi:soluble lytic murein transglycosylase-like protein
MGVTLAVLLSTSVTASFGDTSGAWSASHGTVDSALAAVTICKPGYNPGEPQLAEEKHALLKAMQTGGAALSATDATHYQQAFAAAAQGDWAIVEKAVAAVDDKRLVGTLWQMHLTSPGYQPAYPELARWLQTNNDLPGADDIYRQAVHRKPAGSVPLARPQAPTTTSETAVPDYTLPGIATLSAFHLEGSYGRDERARVTRLTNTILTHLRDDAAITALQVLQASDSTSLLTPLDKAGIDLRIAAGLIFAGATQNEDGAALELAEESATAMPTPEASWIAGLAAYRLQKYDVAWRHFVEMYDGTKEQKWSASAAAFWAARSDIARGERHEAVHWLKIAAEDRATFYGMLARRALGREAGLNLQASVFTPAAASRLNRIPAGSRALALLQIGEPARAELELQRIEVGANSELKDALLALAETAHFAHLSEQAGFGIVHQGNTGSAYPIPRWKPKNGFSLDPALVYAIMRQESRFDPQAESGSGAIGLMQLMPQTASTLTRRENVEAALREPETNIEIGQHYVQNLLADSEIDNNLVLMAVAYNGGPGNLARWKQGLKASPGGDDPLLFMETLPAGETRAFIEQVLTNYWVYRLRLGEDTDSLTELAAGKWPHYQGSKGPKGTVVASLP